MIAAPTIRASAPTPYLANRLVFLVMPTTHATLLNP